MATTLKPVRLTQFFLYWRKPFQINAETWHFDIASISFYKIEWAEAQKPNNKKVYLESGLYTH